MTTATASVKTLRTGELGSIVLVASQLALALLVVQLFELESRTFFRVLLLASVGFVVHALLPLRHRLPFFALLSLAAIPVAFGLRDGAFLVALGLSLIGICHLPIPLALRVLSLVGVGGLFAVWRMELLPAPWSVAIWPILASMFMFRLALYLHALKHSARRPTPSQALAYFFMLPNVCFPLYPVVDYSTFVRRHFDRAPGPTYAVGMRWIVRGLIQLILYRFVYLYVAGAHPGSLRTLGELVEFLLGTFLLYLRVSGSFHVITGMLHLFGFRLPVTHHLYYLASSFNDFWRRINIYWKDFMMKLVYYPSFFWLRRRSETGALVFSTILVFLATWLLHSYQWFWLRGGFPIEAQDGLFWGILGALVVFGSLRELKRPPKRRLGRGPAWSLSLGLRRVGVFTAICILWSLWSAESVPEWLNMWRAAGYVSWGDLLLVAGLALGGLLVASRDWSLRETDDTAALPFLRRPELHSSALLLAVLVVGQTQLYAGRIPKVAATVASLQESVLNARDAELQHKGYYEKLDNVSRMSAQLWDVQARKPSHWEPLSATAAYRPRDDFRRGELRPGVHITFEDQPLTTNRWGMRDRDYPLEKAAGVYRIAVLGPSLVMGSGVADGETFPDFLEERLNESPPDPDRRYEVLNFGFAGCSLLDQLAILEEQALQFQPDAVFITESTKVESSVVGHLVSVSVLGFEIPYPELDGMVRQRRVQALATRGIPVPFAKLRAALDAVGIPTRMTGGEGVGHLAPAGGAFVRWTLGHIAAVAREHGAVPVFVMLDTVQDPPAVEMPALRDAAAAGFLALDLFDLWQGVDRPALRVAEWDDHPNAAGNRLIAERLLEFIGENRTQLGLGPGGPTARRATSQPTSPVMSSR